MRGERLLLAAVLLLATGLRFTGIAHHVVRGAADFDEQHNFVRPIERMAREGTLDPVVYQGYPGLFNWIAAGPVLAGGRIAGYAGAVVGARATVAAFGVLNVGLAFLVARRIGGPWAGLAAAALLAVSRLEVRAAHHVTPDVLVGTATLVTLLLVFREAKGELPTAGCDLALGCLAGLAAAVKFSGLLAGLPGATAAAMSRGFVRRGLRMSLAAVVAFGLGAPFAVSELVARGGKLTGLTHYYGERADRNQAARGGESGFAQTVSGLVDVAGVGGLALAAAGAALARPRRTLVPTLATLAVSMAILAPAAFVYPRHLVPPSLCLAILAGVGLGGCLRLGKGGLAVGVACLAASLLSSASASLRLVEKYLAPSALERAAEWIEANVKGNTLVLAALPRFALASTRFEVKRTARLADEARAVAAHFDLLVTDITADAKALAGFERLARFPSEEGAPERDVTVLGPPRDRTALVEVPVSLLASQPDRITATFERAQRIVRVEVESGFEWPRELLVEAMSPDQTWRGVSPAPLRPTERHRRRVGSREGQSYVLRGEEIRGLRFLPRRPFDAGEVVVRALALAPGEAGYAEQDFQERTGANYRRQRRQ